MMSPIVCARRIMFFSWSQYAADNPLRNCTGCLHAPRSKLTRVQSGFNPHPEVGDVNSLQSGFTRIRFSLIRILNRFKHLV